MIEYTVAVVVGEFHRLRIYQILLVLPEKRGRFRNAILIFIDIGTRDRLTKMVDEGRQHLCIGYRRSIGFGIDLAVANRITVDQRQRVGARSMHEITVGRILDRGCTSGIRKVIDTAHRDCGTQCIAVRIARNSGLRNHFGTIFDRRTTAIACRNECRQPVGFFCRPRHTVVGREFGGPRRR